MSTIGATYKITFTDGSNQTLIYEGLGEGLYHQWHDVATGEKLHQIWLRSRLQETRNAFRYPTGGPAFGMPNVWVKNFEALPAAQNLAALGTTKADKPEAK